MKRAILVLTLALALAGCAGFTKTIEAINGYAVTQNQLDAARSTYDGSVLVPLARYAKFPRCAKGVTISLANLCHDRALLKKLNAADEVVGQAFNDTQDMITSGNNQGAVAAYRTLQAAVAAVQALMATTGMPAL